MREIKFRGKRVDKEGWIYGDLIKNTLIDSFTYISKGIGYQADDPESGDPIKVLPSTVGQFTGLKDKNGVEIYEGDIFQIASNHEYVVDFCVSEEHDFELIAASFVLRGLHATFGFDEYALQTGEVVGNSHKDS